MNTTLIVGIAAVGLAVWYFATRNAAGPRLISTQALDRSSLNYGANTITNPVNSSPLLTQLSWKQAVTDIPSLLDAGGALFTPNVNGGMPNQGPLVNGTVTYADNYGDSTAGTLGNYYNVGAQSSYA